MLYSLWSWSQSHSRVNELESLQDGMDEGLAKLLEVKKEVVGYR